jgi:hypothetical protein
MDVAWCSRRSEEKDREYRTMEEHMIQIQVGRIVQMLLGCALIVGSLLALRLHEVSTRDVGVVVRPDLAIRTYQRRVLATQALLRTEQLILGRK